MVSDTERAIVQRIQASVQDQQSKKQALQRIPVEAIDTQLEAWKKMPKEQALKEALALFRNQGLEPAEVGKKLDVLKFIAEIQGAFEPQKDKSSKVISLRVNFINMSKQNEQFTQNTPVDVEAKVLE